MVSITIDQLTKRFGEVAAVDDVSVEVAAGELFFLLGPSGCGKTTLLRCLAGFYRPDAGRVRFGETDVTEVPPHRRNAGMVFQNYALWPHMNVRKNVVFGLEMHRVPPEERARRVENALAMVQMRPYADRMPNQLSGGQQQRVALARALVLEPDVVLMDEPLSNLDAKLRLELREQIRRIHDQLGLTMVYVTHDQSESLSMADRIAVMRAGRIEQIGTPRDIYQRPATRFTANFIGETNLLAGRIASVGDTVTVDTDAGTLTGAVCFEGASVGDAVACSIRPERLDVLTGDARRANMLSGEVTRTVYLGYHQQYFVRVAEGVEILAIDTEPAGAKAEPGDRVALGCAPDAVVVLPED